jgi:hypothetical protein
MTNSNALRTLICALLAIAAVLATPGAASASSNQLSLLQDDSELLGDRGEDPAAAMAEIRALGVDVIRTNVVFYRVYERINDRTKPAGFDTSDPSESLYSWGPTDRIVQLARQNGVKLMFTVTGPGPHWASEQPSRCRNGAPCTWKPKASEFGSFAAAVAKRYKGVVDWYSLYNEPNIHTWITPEIKQTRYGKVDVGGIYYRKLWSAGYKSIAKHDPARRSRVLFGEVAAIGDPLQTLGAALCIDYRTGKAFRGKLRTLNKCSKRPAKLNIGGYAIHPYNFGAFGTPRTQVGPNRPATVTQAHMPRLHRFMDQAARAKRTPGGRGIYITEFGYQTHPPDKYSNVSPKEQAQYINESDRLFYGDRRVKTVAQYQLVDVPETLQFNSGLRYSRARGGRNKPSYNAYRLPIVVTKRSSRTVEVYGQVRPSVLPGVSATATIQMRKRGGSFQTVGTATGNARGIFRRNVSRSGAAKATWRLVWQDPSTGSPRTSRIAKAGTPLKYYRY